MKQRIWYLILVGLFVSFILISCKTTDTGVTTSLTDSGIPQDLTGPADEASLAALAKARAEAKEARSWAEYMNGFTHCPNEWASAEKRYEAAAKLGNVPDTKKEIYDRVIEWNGIKAAYNEIYFKSFPDFIGEQQDRLAEAREKAVEAGAEELVPDRLALADGYTDNARKKYENGDLFGSLAEGKEAWDRYGILEILALAHAKQAEADEYDFFSVDPDNYMLAAEAGNGAVDLFDEGKLVESRAEAEKALAGFNLVINNAFTSIVEEKASVARDDRDVARAVKADVAVKSDFAAAENVFNQAHTALRAERYAEASALFEKSSELFINAHDKALEKRGVAEEALRRSEAKLAESEERAQYAEDVIGGDE